MKLYRINYGDNDWNALGVVGEEGESLGVLVEVKPTDRIRWCFTHDTQWWADSCMDECDSSCDIGELVRVPKEDNG